MATGDQLDFEARIAATLPSSWFTGTTPVVASLISGMAWGLSFVYSLLAYVKNQTRIATATDGWLDMISADFFGASLPRKANEGDGAFRARIRANLLVERATRAGMIKVLTLLTGRAPVVFEPERPADTGGYGYGCGYGVAGGYGSTLLPCQAFVTAYRPSSSGIPGVPGYGGAPSGYGIGGEYASLGMVQGAVTDDDIYAAIVATKPAGITVWARISN